ncbi:hypothetical protein ACFFU9_14405 [Mariniflexile ostreae]|uniref:Tetratricopeptide repeat protein n=1 Tax=Mariniflexile ostreae TaxID=1520892 RepID=A0ABV5FES8_9FLAO
MKILLFLLILIPSFLIGQNNDTSHVFERFFYHIAVDLSNSNPSEAIEITDLLYKNSKNKIDKLELLMLKANILKKQEKFGEAIHYALVALQIADNLEDHNFQSQIYGFLSSQYRAVGFLDKGKEFIKKGKAVNTKIACKITALKQRGMIDYEAAEYAIGRKVV